MTKSKLPYKSIVKELSPVNGGGGANSSANYSYSTSSSGTGTTTYNPGITTSTSPIISNTSQSFAFPTDYWITDGAKHYNLTEMCREFDKIQKTMSILLTPIKELPTLMLDEDRDTRELATLYYEKLKQDLEAFKDTLDEKADNRKD